MAHIELKNVTKTFGNQTALRNLDLEIADGEFFVLLGETGAGKTTTLRLVAGLDKPTEGQVFIDGIDVADWGAAERDVALVLQQYSLYPRYTVRQNLEFPLKSKLRRVPDAEIAERVARVAKTLRIEHLLERKTDRLSGGEMQRVSIGRALVRRPEIFLMDEPLSSLDAKLRAELRVELKRIQSDLVATLLYVTHDQIEAMTMATHVGVLDEGKLVQFGSPREIYENPASVYVATRLGQPRINLLPASLFSGAPAGADRIGLRPENIRQGAPASGEGRDAVVTRIEHLGDQTRLHLSLEGQELVTLTDPHTPLAHGDRISVRPDNPLYFDASGARIVQGA